MRASPGGIVAPASQSPTAAATASKTIVHLSLRAENLKFRSFGQACRKANITPPPIIGHHTAGVSMPARYEPITSIAVESIQSPSAHPVIAPSPESSPFGTNGFIARDPNP